MLKSHDIKIIVRGQKFGVLVNILRSPLSIEENCVTHIVRSAIYSLEVLSILAAYFIERNCLISKISFQYTKRHPIYIYY